jgi:hypothetical protein
VTWHLISSAESSADNFIPIKSGVTVRREVRRVSESRVLRHKMKIAELLRRLPQWQLICCAVASGPNSSAIYFRTVRISGALRLDLTGQHYMAADESSQTHFFFFFENESSAGNKLALSVKNDNEVQRGDQLSSNHSCLLMIENFSSCRIICEKACCIFGMAQMRL